MVHVMCKRFDQLSARLRDDLGRYRHQVFIRDLGWDVVSTSFLPEREFDQFDHPGTRYIIALDARGNICGCSRLLPTGEPYLLGEVFGYLCDEAPPADPLTWEISRFAASADQGSAVAMRVFWYSLHKAWQQGAGAVVAVTTQAMERYFLRHGVALQRLGAPQVVKGERLLALSFAAFQPNGVKALRAQGREVA
ncbi:MAG: acyl-homoserine-lactone synthase [Pseudomonas sp.]|uniref:acyl-homoserine-lactone synthase n=1 Tax=Pseudomonas abieticivorans TaxID=2931382 RepID=UPI0020C1043C|nr:acyl-homoserine-lactone synthase [Pseudomonas sp. PIA16]MDE1166658.1 acyl-homoserine-lactone synthase [Pseudomonas sp.]